MTVKIITDSVADVASDIVEGLEITVIPLLVRFGTQVYRDGIELSTDEFFERIEQKENFPVTSVPPPIAFKDAYDKLAEETSEILVLTLTSKLSDTHEVAV